MLTQNKRAEVAASALPNGALQGAPMSNHAMEMTMNTHITLPTGSATLTMSSREIADLTGKRHLHILRDARKMMRSLELDETNFGSTYVDDMNREQQKFMLPKRECLIPVSGYSTELRAKIIDRWLELEAAASGGGDLGLIQLADSARVASEATRDLIIHQAGSTRGAVIKAVKDFAGNPIAALKRYLDDRFVALHQRDVHFHRAIGELLRQTSSVTALAERSAQPTTFVAGEWVDLDMVLHMAGHWLRGPRPKALNVLLVKSLDDFCLETNRWGDSARSPFGRRCRIWRKPVVQAWLKDRGRALIDQHIARNSGSNVLQFAKSDGDGK